MEDRLQSHYALLSRTIEFTRTADAKATPVIFLNLAFLGAVSTRFNSLTGILTNDIGNCCWVVVASFVALWLASTIASLAIASLIYVPKNPPAGGSLIYFEDIATTDGAEFIATSKQLKNEDIEQELLEQIHIVSGIVSKKMRRVKLAFYTSILSTVSTLALLGLSSLIGTSSTG